MTINDGSASNQLIKSDLQKLRWWWANVQLELLETGLDLKQRAPSWPSFIYSQKIFLYSSSQKFKDAKPLLSLWVFDYNLVKYVSVKSSNSVYETIKIIVRYIFKNQLKTAVILLLCECIWNKSRCAVPLSHVTHSRGSDLLSVLEILNLETVQPLTSCEFPIWHHADKWGCRLKIVSFLSCVSLKSEGCSACVNTAVLFYLTFITLIFIFIHLSLGLLKQLNTIQSSK